jgi:thymidylate synthase ThyX
VTNTDKPIYALKNLPEEVLAVLFAYYSRSRESLRGNLLKLIQERDVDLEARANASSLEAVELTAAREKARQFHEKWVVGYGHASVAQHAVVHLAIEGVSIIATKIIEDTRLASYTEKSTRYVLFDGEKFFRAPRLMQSPHATLYGDTVRFLFNTYAALIPKVVDCIKARVPRRTTQGERAYEMACQAKAYDLLRYLLPAATLTNLRLTINARALEHLLTKLLSDPLAEVRDVGAAMKHEAEKVVPTLLKYADYNTYVVETEQAMRQLGQGSLVEGDQWPPKHGSRCRRAMDTASRTRSRRMISATSFGCAWSGLPLPTTISSRTIPWKRSMCYRWPTVFVSYLLGICTSCFTSSSSVRLSKGIFRTDALRSRCMLKSSGYTPYLRAISILTKRITNSAGSEALPRPERRKNWASPTRVGSRRLRLPVSLPLE